MIKIFEKYRNITTDRIVNVIQTFESQSFDMETVEYEHLTTGEGFIKPLYVFEKTYVLIK